MKEEQYLVKQFADVSAGWEGNAKWVQLYPYDSWDHPFYGTTTIDKETAAKLKESFDNGVRGQKIHSDYEHGEDYAKGKKASGEFKAVEVKDDGLWAFVEFTEEAKKEIDAGEWNYWSTSHYDEWTHPQTKETHEFVLAGGGLTNSPYVKGMVPLNFSEFAKEFATWSTAYKNNLPDSAFAYIEPGGSKDSDGKTTPRSLRHFPFKNFAGDVDLPHVRDAIARAPQADVPQPVKDRVQNMMRRILGAKNHAELLTIEAECAPEEYQEPGTGFADPSINYDDAADTGSRLETPPGGEDGSVPNRSDTVTNKGTEGGNIDMEFEEIVKNLRTELGLGDDDDVVEAVKGMTAEIAPLRELRKEQDAAKLFSEAYPAEAKRLEELEKANRDNDAKHFSESLSRKRFMKPTGEKDDEDKAILEPTTIGFSALALDSITQFSKDFSERKATIEGFRGVLDSIVDGGIVDYGNKGSELGETNDDDDDDTPPKNFTEARSMFAAKVKALREDDKLSFTEAYAEAARQHPELEEAYRNIKPVV